MLTAIVLGLVGAAADMPPVPVSEPVATERADDIVVTAQRRAERPIDVPIALTVIDDETIERLRTRTIRDLSLFVPGLYVESEAPGRAYISVRGIATNVPDISSEPRVSVFVDGVSSSRMQGAIGELYDIARIEIARGPQSTLYGRSALVGAINIVNHAADPARFDYAARAEIGSFETRQFDAMVNLPLGQGTALRLSGRERERRGYVTNLGPGADFAGFRTYAGRARLTIAPGTVGSLDLIATYQHDRGTGSGAKSGTFAPYDPVTGAVLGATSIRSGARLSSVATPGGTRQLAGLTALARFDLGAGLTLSSTTGYNGMTYDNVEDTDGTALPIVSGVEDNKGDQFSQELRVNYAASGVNVMLGINGFTEHLRRRVPVQIDERLALNLLLGGLDRTNPVLRPQAAYTDPAQLAALLVRGVAGVGGTLSNAQALAIAANLQAAHREEYTGTSSASAFDAFADAAMDLTPRLHVQAGIRLSIDDKRTTYRSTSEERSVLAGYLGALRQPAAQRTALLRALAAPGAAFILQSTAFPLPVFAITAQPSNGTEARSLDSTGLSWRFTAQYDVADGLRVFGSYARGRRPDVTSAAAPLTPGGAVVFTDLAAETVDSVELGTKAQSDGGRWRFDGTIYGYRYRNFQTQVLRDTRIVSIDAGRARAYGGEAQLEYRPADALSLVAHYAYNHGRFREGLFDGNRFRLNPDHTASLAVVVRAPIGAGHFEIAPSLAYRSRFFFDDTNGDLALLSGALVPPIDYHPSQRGYAVSNARLRYRPSRASWAIDAFVDNAFDVATVRGIGSRSLDFGLPTYIAGPPRVFGVALVAGALAR